MATGWALRRSNPGGGEIFRTCQDRPWGPSRLLHNGYRVFPGGKERPGRDADPSPPLVPWSRKSRAIPLLPLWAVRPVQSLSACTVELYLYSYGPYGLYRASVRVQGCILPLFTFYYIQTESGSKKQKFNPEGTGGYSMESEQFYIHLHYKEQLQSTYYMLMYYFELLYSLNPRHL